MTWHIVTQKTLLTEVEQRLTVLSEGWWYTVSSRKKCNMIFFGIKYLHFLHNLNNMLLNYFLHQAIFSMNITIAMALLRMLRRLQLVSQFKLYAHIFAYSTFLMPPSLYSPGINCVTLKNVTRSKEINMRYNNLGCLYCVRFIDSSCVC